MYFALVSTILFLQQFPHGIIYYHNKKIEYSRSYCRTLTTSKKRMPRWTRIRKDWL